MKYLVEVTKKYEVITHIKVEAEDEDEAGYLAEEKAPTRLTQEEVVRLQHTSNEVFAIHPQVKCQQS